MGKGCPVLSGVLAAALVMSPCAAAETTAVAGAGGVALRQAPLGRAGPTDGPDGARPADAPRLSAPPKVTVTAGGLSGTLLDSRAKPVAKVAVAVLAGDGARVAEAVTAADGTFTAGNLAVGDYTLTVGDRPPLRLTAAEAPRASAPGAGAAGAHLLIIIPTQEQYAAGALTPLAWTWVVVGCVVVATAVTLPLALTAGSEGEESAPPPPATAKPRRRLSP